MPENARSDTGSRRAIAEPLPDVRAAVSKRILVVEDSPSARKLIQELLLRLGGSLPNLRLAGTVPEALALFASWEPQIAIIDLQLRGPSAPASAPAATAPGAPTTGAELTIQILQRNPGLKVIICSASEPQDTVLKPLLQKGRVLSMMKPVLASKLAEVLAKATEPPAVVARER
jgi:CheY-like chemotaxis protein